jgi:hypothetical protein
MHTPATNPRPLAALCAGGLLLAAAQAGIPEPFNLVFGQIKLGTNIVTRANGQVVVEARRLPNAASSAIARYVMGSEPSAGDFYALRIKLESALAGSPAAAGSAENGTVLYLTVLSGGSVQDQLEYAVGPRGTVRRLDFGNIDSDRDGLSDGWEQAYLYSLKYGPNDDPDGDGESNLAEFTQGLNPLKADSRHPADINPADNRLTIKEISDYYTAWKNGRTWSRGPVPIEVDYVTRATFIWENGEVYRFDSSASSAPLWWVPAGGAGTNAEEGSALASADQKSADSAPAAAAETPAPAAGKRSIARAGAPARAAETNRVDPLMIVTTHAPETYLPGSVITITNDVTVLTGLRTYAVEHFPPAGWEVVAVGPGGVFDEENSRVKWGPFFDKQPRQLTYQVRVAANQQGGVPLTGRSAFDGHLVDLAGSGQIIELPTVPGELTLLPGGRPDEWNLRGEAGRSYRLEVSADLQSWTELGVVTAATDGSVRFSDPEAAAGQGGRFFRARVVQ